MHRAARRLHDNGLEFVVAPTPVDPVSGLDVPRLHGQPREPLGGVGPALRRGHHVGVLRPDALEKLRDELVAHLARLHAADASGVEPAHRAAARPVARGAARTCSTTRAVAGRAVLRARAIVARRAPPAPARAARAGRRRRCRRPDRRPRGHARRAAPRQPGRLAERSPPRRLGHRRPRAARARPLAGGHGRGDGHGVRGRVRARGRPQLLTAYRLAWELADVASFLDELRARTTTPPTPARRGTTSEPLRWHRSTPERTCYAMSCRWCSMSCR